MSNLPFQLRYKVSVEPNAVVGYVYDIVDFERRFVVELWIDAAPIASTRADLFVSSLREDDEPARRCGFYFSVPLVVDHRHVEVRLANLDIGLGGLLALRGEVVSDLEPQVIGFVRWLGGLRLQGWISPKASGEPPSVHAWLAGVEIAGGRAETWTHLGGHREDTLAHGFDLHLPGLLADGDVHRIDVTNEDGVPLDGSPLIVVAFVDGLRNFLLGNLSMGQEILRGEVYDRLLPQSLPFSHLEGWLDRFPIVSRPISALSGIVLVGEGSCDVTLASLGGERNWIAFQPPCEGGQTTFGSDDLLRVLEKDTQAAEILVFTLAGAKFLPGGLGLLLACLHDESRANIAYADLIVQDENGASLPIALPEFSYERLLEQGYATLLFAIRRETAISALSHGVSDLFALFFHAVGRDGREGTKVVHAEGFAARLPTLDRADATSRLGRGSVAHLVDRGVLATTSPVKGTATLPAVRVRRVAAPMSVSVIIPTRDRVDLLRSCVESIEGALSRVDSELIIVDNETTDPSTLTFFDKLTSTGAQILRVPGPFNYSRLNNRGVQVARGEVLLLLNNDIEALEDDWLEEMLGRLVEHDVGAVGAKLLWPSGVVQHGGVTLGLGYAAGHAFNEVIDDAPGYADLLCVAREVSAVTAACLATRRQHYEMVGGFDEIRFPVNFNDVDYCLKQRACGHRVIFTPHARLIHRESASRGVERGVDRSARFSGELRALREKWPDALANDPFYSPLLSLDGVPYTALAWPPRLPQRVRSIKSTRSD